jgi:hypothetical protein
VLTDYHSGDRFQDFPRPHHGSRFHLRGRDCALTRRRCDPDEILSWVVDVRHAAERRGSGHDDVGAEGKKQAGIGNGGLTWPHLDGFPDLGKVDQPEGQFRLARRNPIEPVSSFAISAGRRRRVVHNQIDLHGGEWSTGLIGYPSDDDTCVLGNNEFDITKKER